MEKLIRRCFIVAGILVAAGIVLCAAGTLGGGMAAAKNQVDQLFEKNSVVISKNGNGSPRIDKDGLPMDNGDSEHVQTDGVNRKMEYAASEVKNLDIEVNAAMVEITENEGDKFIIETENGAFETGLKNGTLSIKSSSTQKDAKAYLQIPKDFVFGEADFEIDTGKISVNQGRAKELSVSVGSGSFMYAGSITRECEIECIRGNAAFLLEEREEDFNYEIECAAGTVIVGDQTFESLEQEKHISHGADAAMDIECSMGNVSIKF